MEEKPKYVSPEFVSVASSGRGRSGSKKEVSNDISGNLSNIRNGISPFSYQNGDVSVSDAIMLCQKAYWNVPIFRITIDIMSEFANSNVHFIGKNKASTAFFTEWYKKIKGWNLGDQFFRELFRSSNVFLFRVSGELSEFKSKKAISKIPLRYLMLNPADIRCSSAASFIDGSYKKVLNDYEVQVLKQSKDPKTVELLNSLPQKVRDDIKKGVSTSIPLSPDDLCSIFFKKQDYEPLAVPAYFSVLSDINLKQEFKKAEQILARACDYMLLLINMGDEKNGCDQEVVTATRQLFEKKDSVGRVLIADWSTKAEFKIPDLAKILGPEKYEAVNQDIANGLMNIFFGDQKYADSMIKIKVFMERLKEARKVFLNEFLIPEMEKIGEVLGFREIPTPIFEEVDIKDEVEYMKLYNRLAELGFLTQEETISAYKTHVLPEKYDSIVSQEEFKKEKENGFFQPIGVKQNDGGDGRPTGTPQKQKDKKVTPVGQGSFSAEKVIENSKEFSEFIEYVSSEYKKANNVSRLSKGHKAMARNIAFSIMQNEEKENWKVSFAKYFDNPMEIGPIFNEISEIASEHSLNFLTASLLYHSKVD